MAIPKSSRECVLDAWVNRIADFRAWCKPETQHAHNWKTRPFSQAVGGCRAQLVDDAEAMLTEWRINENADVEGGSTAFIPVMLTAIASIEVPPDVGQIMGVPYLLNSMIPNDPLEREVQLRTIPAAWRAQIAYFSTNPHDAQSIANQFCAYMTDDAKRRFQVSYDLGGGFVDQWDIMVLENNLFPSDAPNESKNMSIFTVDVTMIGLVPHVIGLGGDWDSVTDAGYNPLTGEMGGDNGGQDPSLGLLVVQADFDDENTRVVADPDTGDVTTEVIPP